MGGIGSTRWHGHVAKPLVEDALALDCLRPPIKTTPADLGVSGSIRWGPGDEPRLQLAFQLWPARRDNQGTEARTLVLARPGPHQTGQGIALVRKRVGFNLRWYAECPGCGRTVRMLYTLSRQDPEVRCRWCYRLEYRSVREHRHHRDQLAKAFRLIDETRIAELSKGLQRRPGYHRLAAARVYVEAMGKAFPGAISLRGNPASGR